MDDQARGGAPKFDEFADHYDHELAKGLAVSGEDKDYFARRRVEWLRRCLGETAGHGSLMEFGCGTGSNLPHLIELLQPSSLVGIDVSARSLERAKVRSGCERATLAKLDEYTPNGRIDLVFCNGVFHHIAARDRAAAADYIYRSLRPGGLFAMWENNPWNPGTRYVMSRIEFDKHAVMLSALEAARLLKSARFRVQRTDFLFIFPRMLKWLRAVEPIVSRIPAGAQYQVLAVKPLPR